MEGFRPDVAVLDTSLLSATWYLDFLRRQYPQLMKEASQELAAFQRMVDLREQGRRQDAEGGRAYLALLNKLIALKQAEGGSVFFSMEIGPRTGPRKR